ncbi:MAG: T9SS C-terminal target domain-containing protein [Saprospirales bacterium]|nr:MAG: T9SS C-terminal target domain-containing protein [Saprospirales bacterium]
MIHSTLHLESLLSKTISISLVLTFTLFSIMQLTAQSVAETNREALLEIAEESREAHKLERQEVLEKMTARSLPMRVETPEGMVYELMRFVNGIPEYYTNNNVRAAISTGTNHLQPTGRTNLDLEGEGMVIGEWDAGAVLETHQELMGRVEQRDGATQVHNHAVHVAGTLIASGVRPDARGMAPAANLWAHDWSFDSGEMAEAAADGLLISNHSYGSLAGWAFGDWSGESGMHWFGDISIDPEEDYKFGFYNSKAALWDQISYNAPYYLIVKSAGNNRNDDHSGPHFVFHPDSNDWVMSSDFRQPDGGALGFDCIPTYGNAKNILTVGAVRTVSGGYSSPNDVNMSNFSSWGPTNDGRVKPDIVGDGVGLLSSHGTGNAAYNTSSGTSMSGPNVAGSLLLIQELHQRLYGEFMLSSSLRSLAIHTADETGTGPGPDYSFGWGLLNAERAAEFLLDPAENKLIEDHLHQSDTLRIEIFGDGNTAVKATLAWIDPHAPPPEPALNDRTPMLMNDLDMRIIATSGVDSGAIYKPYILDPDNPSAPAETGDNFRDNVEMVFPGVLPEGNYLVQITHKGELHDNSPQLFSLLISAPPAACEIPAEIAFAQEPSCFNTDDGMVVLSGGDGLTGLTFADYRLNFQDSDTFSNISPGIHHFYLKDNLGCMGSAQVNFSTSDRIEAIKVNQVAVRLTEPKDQRRQFIFSNSAQTNGWGGDPNQQIVTGSLVRVDDGSNNGILGCGPLVNAAEVEGNIALALRSSCQFSEKALNAQEAGAIAIIIVNNEEGVMSMGGGNLADAIDIPVYMVSLEDGQFLANLIDEGGLELTMGMLKAITETSCPGSSDGGLEPFISGGEPPYTYAWSTGDTSVAISGLSAGTHHLTVTDSRSCIFEMSMVVGSPDSLRLDVVESQTVSCPGEADGMITVQAAGGTPPYQYEWSTGQGGPQLGPVPIGTFYVTVTDANDCQAVDSFAITNPDSLLLDSLRVFPTCPGEESGRVSIDLSGGTAPFLINWDHGADSLTSDSLAAGTYYFTVTDICGFQVSDSVELPESSGITATIAEVQEPLCSGDQTGLISVEVETDVEDFRISWSHGDSVTNPIRLLAGTYSFTATDACGSAASDTATLEEPDPVRIVVANIEHPQCPGSSDGSIEVRADGGTGPLTLNWITGDTGQVVSDLLAGIYIVNATDTLGCSQRLEIALEDPRAFNAEFSYELEGGTIQFMNESDSAEFIWSFGDGNSSTERSPTHQYGEDGEYEICLTAITVCDTITICETAQIVGTSVTDLEKSPLIRLYPNPAFSDLNVEIDQPDLYYKVKIYSATGKLVKQRSPESHMFFDLRNFPPGIYMLRYGPATEVFVVGK